MRNRLKTLAALCVVFVVGGSQAAGHIDTATGRVWRQLTETAGLTYVQLTADPFNGCSADTGACAGSLALGSSSVAVAGWTWATVQEVGELFGNMGVLNFVPPFAPYQTPDIVDSAWAAAIVDIDGVGVDPGYFNATGPCPDTSTGQSVCRISGITRSLGTAPNETIQVYAGLVQDSFTGADYATTRRLVALDSSTNRGVWLYQPIPEPETHLLMLAGLGMLGLLAHRRKATKV